MELHRSTGLALKAEREKRNWSPDFVREKLERSGVKITPQLFGSIESGVCRPDFTAYKAWCTTIFQCSLTYIQDQAQAIAKQPQPVPVS